MIPMQQSLDAYLEKIAGEMGAFLRDFSNNRVHLGSSQTFARQFRTLLEYPVLRSAQQEPFVSYLNAAESYRLSPSSLLSPADPVDVLLNGLAEISAAAAQARAFLSTDNLREDLKKLLRIPALIYYLQIKDARAFIAALKEIARKKKFKLAHGSDPMRLACPACGSLLARPQGRTFICPDCSKMAEVVFPLPMVNGFGASVSYDLLRELVALGNVITYQEESEIAPARN
jgi:predicted RNA-binding Zn-ribbon protein involved in translation (DUF1610 family)